MVEQHALVIAIQGQQAQVEIVRQKPCGICGQTKGCGVSIWGKLFAHQTGSFAIDNTLQAKVGDRVILAVEDGTVISIASLAYGMPLVMLLVGGIVGQQFVRLTNSNDVNALIGAVIGFVVAYALLRRRVNGLSNLNRYQPYMIKVLSDAKSAYPLP